MLHCGNASEWTGTGVDLVLTNPYAALPPCLRSTPAIVSNFAERKSRCEGYIGRELDEIATWGRGHRNRVWVAGLDPVPVDLSDLIEDEETPRRGWFPLELPLRLLRAYARPGMTICDPFMGRGTVGKACLLLGMKFIGIDRDPDRVELARRYIGC